MSIKRDNIYVLANTTASLARIEGFIKPGGDMIFSAIYFFFPGANTVLASSKKYVTCTVVHPYSYTLFYFSPYKDLGSSMILLLLKWTDKFEIFPLCIDFIL